MFGIIRGTCRFADTILTSATHNPRRRGQPSALRVVVTIGVALLIGYWLLVSSAQTSQSLPDGPAPIGWVITGGQEAPIYPGQAITDPAHFWPNATAVAQPSVARESTTDAVDRVTGTAVLGILALTIGLACWAMVRRRKTRTQRDTDASASVQHGMRNRRPENPDDPPHPWRPYPGGPFDLG